jgi:hypothetical protein
LLVDRWSEDWSDLAWLRIEGRAALVDGDPAVIAGLRAKYPQYVDHDLESRPMIAVTIERATSWGVSTTQPETTSRVLTAAAQQARAAPDSGQLQPVRSRRSIRPSWV